MRPTPEMLLFVAVLAVATILTRFLPFWLPAKWTDNRFVHLAKRSLPAVILLLLTIYSLKDVAYTVKPWGLPELVSLAVVMGLHLWKKNALLSIAAGTGLYMLWANGFLLL
ncbi:MAG: AzlD domain-containing protein [Spirochaetales bacterium]